MIYDKHDHKRICLSIIASGAKLDANQEEGPIEFHHHPVTREEFFSLDIGHKYALAIDTDGNTKLIDVDNDPIAAANTFENFDDIKTFDTIEVHSRKANEAEVTVNGYIKVTTRLNPSPHFEKSYSRFMIVAYTE